MTTGTKTRSRSKEPKQKPAMKNRFHKKGQFEVNGHIFDSADEARYYAQLEKDPAVKHIELHPEYILIEEFEIRCGRCNGNGKVLNVTTSNMNKCSICKGTGQRRRAGNKYTADFKVEYIDGFIDVVDVKKQYKGADNDAFPLRKKLFEMRYGIELTIMRWHPKTKEFVKDK